MKTQPLLFKSFRLMVSPLARAIERVFMRAKTHLFLLRRQQVKGRVGDVEASAW